MPDAVSVVLITAEGTETTLNVQRLFLTETKYGFSLSGDTGIDETMHEKDVAELTLLGYSYPCSNFAAMKLFKKESGFEVVGVK